MYLREWCKFDFLVVEPYNSLKKPTKISGYQYDYDVLAEFRMFSQKYCSITIAAHVRSEAARNKDSDGNVRTPIKADIEGGQPFANRADDFIMFHRNVGSKDSYRHGLINVQKIKMTETGGRPTPFDTPVTIVANDDLCGFSYFGGDEYNPVMIDPIKEYWKPRLEVEEAPYDPLKGGMFQVEDGEPF